MQWNSKTEEASGILLTTEIKLTKSVTLSTLWLSEKKSSYMYSCTFNGSCFILTVVDEIEMRVLEYVSYSQQHALLYIHTQADERNTQ